MDDKKKLFRIGQRIEISREEKRGRKFYPSQILDIIDKNVYVISGPIYKTSFIMVHKNEIIKISCAVKNKGRFCFEGRVLERKFNKIYIVKIQQVSKVYRTQERNYYRFPINIKVIKKFVVGKSEKEEIIEENCESKDISGNGIALKTSFKHSIGDIVGMSFDINDRTIDVMGKVVRIKPVDVFYYKYEIGVNFCDIASKDRETIIKYIFEREIRMREKGLI